MPETDTLAYQGGLLRRKKKKSFIILTAVVEVSHSGPLLQNNLTIVVNRAMLKVCHFNQSLIFVDQGGGAPIPTLRVESCVELRSGRNWPFSQILDLGKI